MSYLVRNPEDRFSRDEARICNDSPCYVQNFGNEPHRDKTNKMASVPSEDSDQPGHPPSLIRDFACTQRVAKDPSFLHADSEDSDQTGQMPRLI